MNDKDLKASLFIIDGSSFLYRAYYSIPTLTSKDGMAVNAVYGFCRMIKRLIDKYEPSYIVLIWDSPGKTVRHEIYEKYKETRQAAPNDLYNQKNIISEFANQIGLIELAVPSVEADDLMYSMAKQLEKNGDFAVLVTSDKDLRQVVSDKVVILDPFKDKILTKQDLEQELEFSLDKLSFYYALVGDASDNIPGVKGIGPKTAQGLVKQFNSLQDLYSNIDKVQKERIKNILINYKDNAFLSKQLFELRFYDIALTKNCCEFKLKDWEKAREFFEKYEFRTFLKSMGIEQQVQVEPLNKKYSFKTINTVEQLNSLCNQIKQHKQFAIDTEGISIRPLESEMVGFSVCIQENIAYYIPFGHKTNDQILNKQQLDKDLVLNTFKPILEDSSIEKYLHHAKFDILMFYNMGIELQGVVFDTMIAANLLAEQGQRIGLKKLSEYRLQERMLNFSDVVKKNKYPDFSYVPIDLATEYAAADAHQTLKLYNLFKLEISQHNMQELFNNLEMPLLKVLYKMEKTGISIDKEILEQINKIVSCELERLYSNIIALLGPEYSSINLNSPKQLEDLLFNYLNLPAIKKTAQKTSYSTDHEVLKELSKVHAIPGLIIKYRELFKLKSTYLETLGTYVNSKTNRVHTTFSQTSVATGRLSSSDPNLQNIPVDRFSIRSAFKAAPGHVLLSADYSQIELRVLGYLSQDTTLLNAFDQDKDIHALTASGLFGVSLENIDNTQRQIGKRINFGILYGLTAHGLSKELDINHALAKEYIRKFMSQYLGVSSWMDCVVEKAKEKGYVETLFNRRRYLPGIWERNRTIFELAKRMAINTIVQGTAAEIVKLGMINLDKAFEENELSAKILLQIHDELLLEVPKEEIEKTAKIVKEILQSVVNWNIPLIVTTKVGSNWQEVTK